MSGNLIGGSLQIWRSAIDYLNDRRRSRAAAREFEALGLDESTRVLSESGLTPSEFDHATRLPFASEDLLTRAMNSIGIDPIAFESQHRAWYRDACRTCMMCDHRRQCRRDIGNSDFARTYRRFCPNSENFEELIRGQEVRACGRSH